MPKLKPRNVIMQNKNVLLVLLVFVTICSLVEASTCSEKFRREYSNNETDFLWDGHPFGLLPGKQINQSDLMLVKRSEYNKQCGTRPEYYTWDDIASTLTTWILPLIGLVFQLPFESNGSIWALILLTCRWLGNPIATLTAIMWNMRVTSKCALFADTAGRIGQAKPKSTQSTAPVASPNTDTAHQPSDTRPAAARRLSVAQSIASMRMDPTEKWWQWVTRLDKTIDQYIGRVGPSRPGRLSQSPDEKVRDSLYILSVINQYEFTCSSNNLKSVLWRGLWDTDPNIEKYRQKIAATLRSDRKHGVVLIFGSLIWFFMSLAISIVGAFGDNSHSRGLALGLCVGWLPILVIDSIVDRNPVHADDHQITIEDFLQSIEPLKTPKGQQAPKASKNEKAIATSNKAVEAGSSSNGEDSNIRGTKEELEISANGEEPDLEKGEAAPKYLLGFAGQGRRKWHYGIAHSFLRTLKYKIVLEERPKRGWAALYDDQSLFKAEVDHELWLFNVMELWQMIWAFILVLMPCLGAFVISFHDPTVGLGCRSGGIMIYAIIVSTAHFVEILGWFCKPPEQSKKQHAAEILFRIVLTTLEVLGTGWLLYVVGAQTFGGHNTCDCNSSTWGGGGGYVTFGDYDNTKDYYVLEKWWYLSTAFGCVPLGLNVLYAVLEWCLQSHLWSFDKKNATERLSRVRIYRTYTWWLHYRLYPRPGREPYPYNPRSNEE